MLKPLRNGVSTVDLGLLQCILKQEQSVVDNHGMCLAASSPPVVHSTKLCLLDRYDRHHERHCAYLCLRLPTELHSPDTNSKVWAKVLRSVYIPPFRQPFIEHQQQQLNSHSLHSTTKTSASTALSPKPTNRQNAVPCHRLFLRRRRLGRSICSSSHGPNHHHRWPGC